MYNNLGIFVTNKMTTIKWEIGNIWLGHANIVLKHKIDGKDDVA